MTGWKVPETKSITAVKGLTFFLCSSLRVRGGLRRQQGDDLVVALLDIGANDDLVHTLLGNDLHHTVQSFQGSLIGLAVILQLEAETGHAVAEAVNIGGTADVFQDLRSEGFILFTHKSVTVLS